MRSYNDGECGNVNLKLLDVDALAEFGGDVSEHDRKGEKNLKLGEHDIHADDIEVFVEEDGTDEEKEDESAKCWMRGPTLVTKLQARIIQGREHEFVVNITNVQAPTSSFTNMQIPNKKHATEIYGRLLTQKSVASLTLRPMAYYNVCVGEVVEFNIRGGQDQFLEVLQNWPEGSNDEEK